MGSRRGEADHIARQPRKGHRQRDGMGRVWRKVRRLSRDSYEEALLDAAFEARLGTLTDEHLMRLGYEVTDAE